MARNALLLEVTNMPIKQIRPNVFTRRAIARQRISALDNLIDQLTQERTGQILILNECDIEINTLEDIKNGKTNKD